ncbi:MAG: S-methyl-5-thioribose-1-phosphate isomerase [Dehalococcoidia bacterium]|nr:S-methyl-5-thioribose-1-phosphate isomerase [Dehalococcoidia bacterium]MDD5494799.1 S-methyl-5-thioribose-1-phosphate isomerase [Dehalococcoidia bacterium]
MKPVEWLGDRLKIIDQSRLPDKVVYLELKNYHGVISAIVELKVRGAPAIGIAAAYGIALGAMSLKSAGVKQFDKEFQRILREFAASRPTAVNLFYAIDKMRQAAAGVSSIEGAKKKLLLAAETIRKHEESAMRRLSKNGSALIKDGWTILTHCNTGSLATGTTYGTALGVIKAAGEQGKKIRVFADETRPVLQGARLTTWELIQEGIPVTLITDNMAGYLMSRGLIDCAIVGADRIAANGDTANKIGTYSVAVLCKENRVPFYVAAPLSSIDINIRSGRDIIIEDRNPDEVTSIRGIRIAPEGVQVMNPAFDVTPHKYISAIITEKSIIKKPYKLSISKLFEEEI